MDGRDAWGVLGLLGLLGVDGVLELGGELDGLDGLLLLFDGLDAADLQPAPENTNAAITAASALRVIIRCMGNSCEMSYNCRRLKSVLVSRFSHFFVITS